ncbi:MAG: cryptochrome/photolyase family protein [Polyangiaceae bacterium]
MSAFRDRLRALQEGRDPANRRWVFVPYDQLTDALGPLAKHDPRELGIVVVECPAKAARRPYHRQKLALVLANLRHFALEQAARGVAVVHVVSEGDYAAGLGPLLPRLGPLVTMEPAERELRVDLAPLVSSGGVRVVPHEGWLTTPDDFVHASADGRAPWRMDKFYAAVRRRTGILMDRGRPRGGKFSFDAENRKPWRGVPTAPEEPSFEPDAITQEVGDLVRRVHGSHPGTLDLRRLPATLADARLVLSRSLATCLPVFGPFEDAMSTLSRSLFHTRLSPLLNLHRVTPRSVLERVVAADLPLASQEAFVRQLLGWREFVHHVHVATDGFRTVPGIPPTPDANPSVLGARRSLPMAYWDRPSGLACLDRVVADVWAEGYSHHITRLMILSNVAQLLDVDPRELTDWFWIAYVDAYDWVVEPNVLAMGTYGAGDCMVTKPYVAGAAYVNRMSDYCRSCAFDPKTDCPLTPLYWAFLERHAAALAGNPRMAVPLAATKGRDAAKKAKDRELFEHVSQALSKGDRLRPP